MLTSVKPDESPFTSGLPDLLYKIRTTIARDMTVYGSNLVGAVPFMSLLSYTYCTASLYQLPASTSVNGMPATLVFFSARGVSVANAMVGSIPASRHTANTRLVTRFFQFIFYLLIIRTFCRITVPFP